MPGIRGKEFWITGTIAPMALRVLERKAGSWRTGSRTGF